MNDPGAGLIVFLLALFLAVVGATVLVIVVRRGVGQHRPDRDESPDDEATT